MRPATIQYHDRPKPTVDLLDQTRLPHEHVRLHCQTVASLHDAIKRLVVRGAPAIGVAAAYGVLLASHPDDADRSLSQAKSDYLKAIETLASSRPTAVNLFWALDRMRRIVEQDSATDARSLHDALLHEARRIDEEDQRMCDQIGQLGAARLRPYHRILTHCNAGSLATAGSGTALAPLYQLHREGHQLTVIADETRPLLQGARLTAWELSKAGLDVHVCTDSMAASLMQLGQIDAVIVGADRIAANGDAANKIGTYAIAIAARYHRLPFFVAAPTSTLDQSLQSGEAIPIEQRDGKEVSHPIAGQPSITPEGVATINPAFDVTPANLITALITERKVIEPPSTDAIAALMNGDAQR
ncbi:MAG: S-methyl-5-thioribose-1-phosphate isomerase [Planctomycetota bacterium]